MPRPDAHLHLCEQYSAVVAEGVIDRVCGRPRIANPYNPAVAWPQFEAWEFGWAEGDWLLETHAAEEARRWLEEAA